MYHAGGDHGFPSLFQGSEFRGESIAKIDVFFHGCRPEGGTNGLGPAMGSMKKRSTGGLSDIFDAAFGFAILVVGIDATKSEILTSSCNGSLEYLSIKQTIVGMVVGDRNIVSRKDAFKSKLGLDSGRTIHGSH